MCFIHGSQCWTPHKPTENLQGQGCGHNSVEAQEIKRLAISDSQIPVTMHFTQCRRSSSQILKTGVVVFVLFVLSHRNNTPALHFVSTCGTISQGSSSHLMSHCGQQCSSINSRKGLSIPSFFFSATEHHSTSPECRGNPLICPPSQLSDC